MALGTTVKFQETIREQEVTIFAVVVNDYGGARCHEMWAEDENKQPFQLTDEEMDSLLPAAYSVYWDD